MGKALDPERERVANLRRRAAMLERHARARDPVSGKSSIAVAAGRKGGRVTAARGGSPAAWGLRMALKRWHDVDFKRTGRGISSVGELPI
jgi:hypothetical protein